MTVRDATTAAEAAQLAAELALVDAQLAAQLLTVYTVARERALRSWDLLRADLVLSTAWAALVAAHDSALLAGEAVFA
jgi:hypothetical protein